jgi:hypothetical protein
MPASTIATDVRGAIKTALAGCTANIYDSVPEVANRSSNRQLSQMRLIWSLEVLSANQLLASD